MTLCVCAGARADLIVPPNAVMILGGGTTDLTCTDLVVGGELRIGAGGVINARHVTIQPGGSIRGDTGIITLGGNWTNAGQFIAGTSEVRFRDLCGLTSASLSGNSSFATASFVTATGKSYAFAVGTTQTIATKLEIAGTVAQPIQFRSSTPGQVANIDLLPGGTQPIQHVGVTDVWATGQWLAPSLTNEGGGGNANRWFGHRVVAAARQIPTTQPLVVVALAILLLGLAAMALRRRDGADMRAHPRNDC